jgi:hypothetical protein
MNRIISGLGILQIWQMLLIMMLIAQSSMLEQAENCRTRSAN